MHTRLCTYSEQSQKEMSPSTLNTESVPRESAVRKLKQNGSFRLLTVTGRRLMFLQSRVHWQEFSLRGRHGRQAPEAPEAFFFFSGVCLSTCLAKAFSELCRCVCKGGHFGNQTMCWSHNIFLNV